MPSGRGFGFVQWGSWARDEPGPLRAAAARLGARTDLLYLDPPVDLWERTEKPGMEDPPAVHSDLAARLIGLAATHELPRRFCVMAQVVRHEAGSRNRSTTDRDPSGRRSSTGAPPGAS